MARATSRGANIREASSLLPAVTACGRRIALCACILTAFLLGDLDAHARFGPTHKAAPAEGAAVVDTGGTGQLLAKRRRRKRKRPSRRRRKRRKKPTKVQRPGAAEKSAFPEAERTQSSPQPPPAAGGLRRGARVEFDGRLVQGQTAKSGAIYLFARKRSELRSMVAEREIYRREILRTVYPQDEYKAYMTK